MKTTEQTRRELFEAWASKDHVEHDGVCYENPYIESAWHGFNAALDAVVINDPFSGQFATYSDQASRQMRTAIESTGLGLKVK